ncbi:MAG: DUF6580 family putative transport protein [Sphingomicrobium sp.]
MDKLGLTMDNKARLFALFLAIFAAAALRLLPHPPNFSPIAAMALFSGAFLPRQTLAFIAPLAALFLSDLVLGFYPEIVFVYLGVAATVLIGWVIARRKTMLRVGTAAVAGSVLFFGVTNFGVWLLSGGYPRTVEGLIACYVAAIPFFQNTLAGDLFFAALLFGGFALAERLVPNLRQPHGARLAA